MNTVHNFNAGPAVLPAEVIAQIQHDMPNYANTGISILESSHRTKEYEAINQRAMERLSHTQECINRLRQDCSCH